MDGRFRTVDVPFALVPFSSNGSLAQLAEQRAFNPKVEGSIPSGPTTKCLVRLFHL